MQVAVLLALHQLEMKQKNDVVCSYLRVVLVLYYEHC